MTSSRQKWRDKNREKIKEYDKLFYQNNKEKRLEQNKVSREKNKEKYNEYLRKYYQRKKEKKNDESY